jgi:hypothetical protein
MNIDNRRIKVTSGVYGYYVRKNNEANSTEYLTFTPEGKALYTWTKDKGMAALVSYDAAQKASMRYGGHVVKRLVEFKDVPTSYGRFVVR